MWAKFVVYVCVWHMFRLSASAAYAFVISAIIFAHTLLSSITMME